MPRRISVTVKPRARSAALTRVSEGEYRAAVREPAYDGKANDGLIDLLASYFDVPKSAISIVRGHRSRRKIVELG